MTPTAEQQSLPQEEVLFDRILEQGNSTFAGARSLDVDLNPAPWAGSWSLSVYKRCFDFLLALFVLTVSFVPGILIYLLVRLTSSGPGFFKQTRIGFEGRLFTIYKFRTMCVRASGPNQPCLTRDGDHRITGVGILLRKLKLDEVPQFYNVLCGDMSVVGPRPKLRQYVSISDLRYRPGITGPATLFFRDEERLLARIPAAELDSYYEAHIKPIKAAIDLAYMERATFISDLRLILGTAFPSLRPTISVEAHSKSAIIRENRDGTQSDAVETPEASRADNFAMIDSM